MILGKRAEVLVNPGHGDGVVLGQLLILEPEANLLLGRVHGVGAMANIAANLDAKVSPDGSGQGGGRVGLAQHHAAGLDHVQALPHHGDHGSGAHVLDETGEKWLAGEVGVVLLQKILIGLEKKRCLTGLFLREKPKQCLRA